MPTVPALFVSLPLISVLTLCVGVCQAEELEQDIIVLVNGHQIVGTLEKALNANDELVTIVQDNGEFQVPRRLVQEAQLGYTTRRRLLDESDYAAVMALARWCLDKQLLNEAEELIRIAAAHPLASASAVLLLAQLTDAKPGQQQEALQIYRRWRDEFGGNDPEAIARLNLLDAKFSEWEKAVAAIEDKKEEIRKGHKDYLEAKPGWVGESERYANKAQVAQRTIEQGLIKNRILELQAAGGDKYKASVRRRVTFDGSANPVFSFAVYNPGKSTVGISIALKTGSGYVYFESAVKDVKAKAEWVQLDFDLRANDFKSAATGWNPRDTVKDVNNIRELQIQLHNGKRDAAILIDAVPDYGP